MTQPPLAHSPAAERNQAPILAVLRTLLAPTGSALEIACGAVTQFGPDVLVVSQKCVPVEVFQACVRADQIIIDVNGWAPLKSLPCRYEGLCW